MSTPTAPVSAHAANTSPQPGISNHSPTLPSARPRCSSGSVEPSDSLTPDAARLGPELGAGERAADAHGDGDLALLGLDADADLRDLLLHVVRSASHGGHALLEIAHAAFVIRQDRGSPGALTLFFTDHLRFL
nr:hypothetical protein [Glycomyces tenuis]